MSDCVCLCTEPDASTLFDLDLEVVGNIPAHLLKAVQSGSSQAEVGVTNFDETKHS